jgi:hypothetical protein
MLQPRSTAALLCLNRVLFMASGISSILAGFMLHTSFTSLSPGAARVLSLALMAAWAVLAWRMRQGERTPVTAGVDNLSLTKSGVPS